MAREPLPDIGGDLTGRPLHRLPSRSPATAEPSDEQVEANTAKLTTRWATVDRVRQTQAPPSNAPAEPVTPIQVKIPVSLNQQLARAAYDKGCTKTHLILKALADAGYRIDPAFLALDRRKQ